MSRVQGGEQGTGVGGDVVEEKKQASGANERTPYRLGLPSFPQKRAEVRADLRGAFPFTPFAAIVP